MWTMMQKEGHITMLYVLPVFQRKGIGKKLLITMRTYARTGYGYSDVTVNAMPVYTAAYFQKRKFEQMGQVPMGCPYVSMRAKTIEEVSYEKKEIPAGWAIGASVGGLVLCGAIAAAFMVVVMLTLKYFQKITIGVIVLTLLIQMATFR